ncbi:glutathione S-transferase U17-like [Tripterygium wilfordii]|uniref:glutathione S-transferase U17-like n=1 Tax=Tripterygium wilfordii TaxID=458696 RepID=UPI0018F834C9|nr:glutathione S-transferase U17-like [Tripterygium wilfordii]
MAKSDLKLLGSLGSPFVLRAAIALNIKSVDYEFIEDNLAPKSELLLQTNPVHKKIPVLIHNDKPICESLVIVQYIDEAWSSGPPILPSDPYDRAIARFWAAYIDDKWFPSVRGILFAGGEEERKAVLAQVEEGLLLLEGAVVACSKAKAFFGGDEIGFLDIAFGCFLAWLRVIEKANGAKLLDEAKFPNLTDWAERFCAHAAVKDVMPETDKLAKFAKVLQARKKSAAAAPSK